ncbi:hypothetical protein FSW04_16235 [Baekduia soli]|uniref:Uncharacterized protein n=1 Tax=Baekduia soli TaxID=496014 RepID=A0A5B8U832_9ACTN|nr:hypothetical protein [Baekduia soli]QEC48968.1 hypothetical protein FSW04_16235 [Baekduia soli]
MTALELVRTRLAESRTAGLPFEVAWPIALHGVDAAWGPVLEDTADEWRAAFENRPPNCRLLALRSIGEDPDRSQPVDGECEHCGRPLPAPAVRGPRRRYCTARCRRDAHVLRSGVAAAHGRRIAA